MELKLTVRGGSNDGKEIPINVSRFIIGRAPDCNLRAKSDMISRHHCALMVDRDLAAVRDLGSRNGTFVNDKQIDGEHSLKDGDRLRVGPLDFEVHVKSGARAKKRPKVQGVRDAMSRTAQGDGFDDLDVSDWLSEEDDDIILDNDTAEVDDSQSETDTTVAPKSDAKTGPGKLPPVDPTDDSADAAAQALRKHFRRR